MMIDMLKAELNRRRQLMADAKEQRKKEEHKRRKAERKGKREERKRKKAEARADALVEMAEAAREEERERLCRHGGMGQGRPP